MRNLDFKYASFKNFLPFGPDGVEIHFDKYGNIIHVRGENLDAKPIDPDEEKNEVKSSGNGSGKSATIDGIIWTLYGKTVKRPEKIKKDDVVHNKVGKDCRGEVIFGNYRVVRTRNKHSLRFWESDSGVWDKNTELTQGTMDETQKRIEEKIGLSYDAFINIAVFTDDQRSCFLECDGPTKREIVENMLSLGEYREWYEKAKTLRKEAKNKIDSRAKEYQLFLSNKDDAQRRLSLTQKKHDDWVLAKKEELSALKKQITAKTKELAETDVGNALLLYQKAQEKIEKIREKIPKVEANQDATNKNLQLARDKEVALREEAQKLVKMSDDCGRNLKLKTDEKKAKEAVVADLMAEKVGTRCGKCRGVVQEENLQEYADELRREMTDISLDILKYVANGKEITTKVEELKGKQKKVRDYISQFMTKLSGLEEELRTLRRELVEASQVREPKADSAEFLLQQQIDTLKKRLEEKQAEAKGPSPFDDILANDREELEKITQTVAEKEAEIKEMEADLPYYDYWINGFGETGIRKWVIEGIVPELNTRVNYWLQFLIDNKITLKFDSQLNEVIERNPPDGDPYVYHAMSTGQRRRLNLAVSQAFAHIMTISSNATPSFIFLDEVSTNVDPSGVQGIYNMICELAEDKQVFVTTHDQELVRMLQGSDTIRLVHQDGFTKIKA